MKPILFNTEMVKAILDGRKTVTRRLIKPRYRDWAHETGFQIVTNAHTGEFVRVEIVDEWESCTRIQPPPCWPGDILYVRETWQKSRIKKPQKAVPVDFKEIQYSYRADGELANSDGSPFVWRPSIHMPKEAARIFLRVKGVRVERLQDITVDQAAAEGIDNTVPCDDSEDLCNYCPLPDEAKGIHCYGGNVHMCEGSHCKEALEYWEEEFIGEFAALWESTIKDKEIGNYGWDANPWVWVIEFEKISKEEATKC